jgi:transposase
MVVKEHHPLEELVRLMDLKQYAPIRDRIRAVVLALKGQEAPQIARTLDRHFRWIQRWVYRYRDEGLAGLMDRPRRGQPTKLFTDRQAAFEARVEAGPQPEDRICRFRLQDLQRILREEFAADYSLSGVSRLMHRLDYAYLCPRPRHKKNDPTVMEQWKAQAPFLSRGSGRRTRIGG